MPPLPQRVTIRVAVENAPGALGLVLQAAEETGAEVVGVERIEGRRHVVFLDVTLDARDEAHVEEVAAACASLPEAEVVALTDDVIAAHEGGKIEIRNKREVNNARDLSLVYTPGVARMCRAIADDPAAAYRHTIKSNSVAVVTDGTAVLGLGDIGALASMPVMEGKAMLLKSFGGVDAYPILVGETDPDAFVDIVAKISSGFGGINLEDIAAPRCFEIEGKLRQRVDIPVFHDDQHGTAVVVLAALMNAAKVIGRDLADLRVVVQGIGAAGVAICNLLRAAGIEDIVGVDRDGIITPRRRKGMDPVRRRLAKQTNPRDIDGGQAEALDGANVFIGVSGGRTLALDNVLRMHDDRIVFALANPTPEIYPDEAGPHVKVMATGRSDFPNQINNVLCFPGLFRGLLDAAATAVTDDMKIAAAKAIAEIVGDDLAPDYVIPSPFDRTVAPAVAAAVAEEARRSGDVRPGSKGSRVTEAQKQAAEHARQAVSRSIARQFDEAHSDHGADHLAAQPGADHEVH